jgi:hypothetical protein
LQESLAKKDEQRLPTRDDLCLVAMLRQERDRFVDRSRREILGALRVMVELIH